MQEKNWKLPKKKPKKLDLKQATFSLYLDFIFSKRAGGKYVQKS